jgi:hypothetical protein
MVFNLHDDSHAHHSFKTSDMPSHTSALSQPVHGSRRRFQSSVPDLSLLTVTTSSNLAQGLSQSVLDMSRQRGGDHASGLRPHHEVPRGNGAHRSSSQTYHTHLNRMPSDPHLNSDGVHHPGLMRTLLVRLKEEPEHSPTVHRRRMRGGVVGGASSSSQPPRRGYSEIRNRRRTPSPSPRQPSQTQPPASTSHQSPETATTSGHTSSQRTSSSGSTSNSNPELTPTNTQPPLPSTSAATDAQPITSLMTGTLGLAGKSSSNTSLSNLDLIWLVNSPHSSVRVNYQQFGFSLQIWNVVWQQKLC